MSSAAQKLHASFPSAGFPRRFVSWVYDFLVAVAIIMPRFSLGFTLCRAADYF